MKSLVACKFALQLQQTADFLSFADKAQEMSGNNNLQKGLRLTKPKGRATVSDNRPEGFFEVECLPSNLFLSAQQFQSNSRFNVNFRQMIFCPACRRAFLLKFCRAKLFTFGVILQFTLQKVNKCLIIY